LGEDHNLNILYLEEGEKKKKDRMIQVKRIVKSVGTISQFGIEGEGKVNSDPCTEGRGGRGTLFHPVCLSSGEGRKEKKERNTVQCLLRKKKGKGRPNILCI